MNQNLEAIACQPLPVTPDGFNPNANIPYGCTTEHIRLAMNDFVDFLGFINQQLHTKGLGRTITASVTHSGYKKMTDNWIYQAPKLP